MREACGSAPCEWKQIHRRFSRLPAFVVAVRLESPESWSDLASIPKFRPQLATLVEQPPRGPEWLHEVKFDGYRLACTVVDNKVRLESRQNNDWTAEFPEIVEAVLELPIQSVRLDGEVTVVAQSGVTSFQALQNVFSSTSRHGLTYFVFDLLHLNGEDLRTWPLEARKRECERLLSQQPPASPIRYSQHFDIDGAALLERVCALGAEGIVSKRRDQAYRPGRSGWLKTKCFKQQEFVIGGFTEPAGVRSGIGALLLGHREGTALRFAGKVGTGPGFTAEYLTRVRRELDPLEQSECPFDPPPPGWIGRHGRWVRPVRTGVVAFTEWTAAGTLRHPSFQGFTGYGGDNAWPPLLEALAPPPVSALASSPRASGRRRQRASATSSPPKVTSVQGVTISSADRVIYPRLGFTKGDLAQFYADVAAWMLPYVANRPLTVVRCERPILDDKASRESCRFLPHAAEWHRWVAPPVRRIQIQEQTKLGEYLVVDSADALVALVQGDIVEVHTWNSTTDRVEAPDRIVLDLDPGEGVAWSQIVAGALHVHDLLSSLGLRSWPKLTGGKGVHVVVPFLPEHGWDAVYALSHRVAQAVLERAPTAFTLDFAPDKRRHKILIDYKRNHRGAVAVAAFSTRARPTGAVGVPISWRELSAARSSERWTVKNIRQRLRRLNDDPWRDFWTCRQRLSR